MKAAAKTLIFVMALAIALTGMSCKKDTGRTNTAKMPPEHEKMVEQYKKSLSEEKKVVIAKVNGSDIVLSQLIQEMNAVAPKYLKPGQKMDTQTDEKVKKEALDRLIYRELAVQEALRQGMKVSPEVVTDELKKIKAGMKTEEAYRANLTKVGMTEEEFKKEIERNVLVNMITEKEIFGKVTVDPKQVQNTYAKKRASYKGPSGNQMSFEEARPLIDRELMTVAVQKREAEWVENLKKAARIEITKEQYAKEIHRIR